MNRELEDTYFQLLLGISIFDQKDHYVISVRFQNRTRFLMQCYATVLHRDKINVLQYSTCLKFLLKS